MMRLDIGCGAAPRAGFAGVDCVGSPDILCDIAKERLPVADNSVDYIYSSHCLEHIERLQFHCALQEMTRVCADQALIEIWHPHYSHSDAYVIGHANYLSEAVYTHIGCIHRTFWSHLFGGAQWILEEVRYGVRPFVTEDLRNAGVNLDFAVSYMREVIFEIGIFARVDRNGADHPMTYRRSVCVNREPEGVALSDGPRDSPIKMQRCIA
jgi:hypothetical protein